MDGRQPYVIKDSMPCECGSDLIMHDQYEDEDIHWCAHCGAQIVYESEMEEALEEALSENHKDPKSSSVS